MNIKRLPRTLYIKTRRSIPLNRTLHSIRFFQSISVKLVAVARNEAAYLPEWIYHHLYFGFDKIAVYYNNCTDNTVQLQRAFNDRRVEFINADDIFTGATHSPQVEIYRRQFDAARREGFSHLMFLDIDEFWTPANLEAKISDYLIRFKKYDVISFNWMNKVGEDKEFSRAITADKSHFRAAQSVKSVLKSFIYPEVLNPHNVINPRLKYCRDVEGEYKPLNSQYSSLPQLSSNGLKERAFVIHRKYRGEREYIAMLGKGRPIGSIKTVSQFKDNRDGYVRIPSGSISLQFPNAAFIAYDVFMREKLSEKAIKDEIETGRRFILENFAKVVRLIEAAPVIEKDVLKRLLKNVHNDEALGAYKKFLHRCNRNE